MGRILRLVTVVAFVASGACKGAGGDTPDPTVPTAPSTTATTTTAVPDIATIPAVIDEAYLNRVLAALDEVRASGVRIIQEAKGFPPQAAELLNSIYSDDWFNKGVVSAWLDQLAKDPDLKGLKRPVGVRHTKVTRMIAISPSCVWLAVNRDYSETDVAPPPPKTEYVALKPLDTKVDPHHHNPTAWMIITDGYRTDGTEPDNPCPSS